jgi:hypothetical protein
MDKFIKFMDELDQTELELFEKDLKEGYIGKYVERKKEFFRLKDKTCPVCGNAVLEDCFVLIWGEPSIRKKAHFCGLDCMEYFVNNSIKHNIKKGPVQDQKKQGKNATKTLKSNV